MERSINLPVTTQLARGGVETIYFRLQMPYS